MTGLDSINLGLLRLYHFIFNRYMDNHGCIMHDIEYVPGCIIQYYNILL
jgi:hypothetical protein